MNTIIPRTQIVIIKNTVARTSDKNFVWGYGKYFRTPCRKVFSLKKSL